MFEQYLILRVTWEPHTGRPGGWDWVKAAGGEEERQGRDRGSAVIGTRHQAANQHQIFSNIHLIFYTQKIDFWSRNKVSVEMKWNKMNSLCFAGLRLIMFS